jgi:protein disulfide-isomerase-like protein
MELEGGNFDMALKESAVTLVMFYAPWCGHCKEFSPIYAKAADRMAGKVLVAKLDATVEGELAKRYKISGFPTVKLFKGSSEAGVYQGEKTDLGIVEWVDMQTDNTMKLAGNVIQEVTECEDVVARDKNEQVRYVGVVGTDTDSMSYKLLEEVALELRKNRVAFNVFALSGETAARCAAQAGCTGAGCWMPSFPSDASAAELLVVSSMFLDQPEWIQLDGSVEKSVLKGWMIDKSVPAVGDIDDDSSRKYFERQLPVFVAFLDPNEDNSMLKANMGQLAAKMGKQFSFVTGDGIKYRQIVSAMGMSTTSLPQVAIDAIQEEERPTFPFHRGKRALQQDLTVAALEEFAQDYLDGKLQEVDKQQKEEMKEPAESKVHELDDSMFSTLKTKFEWVAVLFFAPWSSEALDLMPAFRELATEYRYENVAFGRNDVTSPSEINRDFSPNVPAVLLFHKGEQVKEPLVGPVTGQTVGRWLSRHFSSTATELLSSKLVDEFLEATGSKVLAVLPLQSKARDQFHSVAKSEKGYFDYGVAAPDSVPQRLRKEGVWVRLENGHEELINAGGFVANAIREQLQRIRVPTVLDFGPESGPILSRFDTIPIVMVLLPSHDWAENQKIVQTAAADKKYAGQIVFLTINTAQMPQVAQSLGMSNDPNDLPAVRLDGRKNAKRPGMFATPDDFKLSAKSLQKLADDYLEGNPLHKVRRSAPLPAEAEGGAKKVYENGVQSLVGDIFDQEVLDADAHVVVYYFAPWCQYCERFTPIYETFVRNADNLKAHGIKFTKMDATDNDSPEFVKVDGFPTVYLFKKDQKMKPIMYDGTPDANGLNKFFKAEFSGLPATQTRLDDEL